MGCALGFLREIVACFIHTYKIMLHQEVKKIFDRTFNEFLDHGEFIKGDVHANDKPLNAPAAMYHRIAATCGKKANNVTFGAKFMR